MLARTVLNSRATRMYHISIRSTECREYSRVRCGMQVPMLLYAQIQNHTTIRFTSTSVQPTCSISRLMIHHATSNVMNLVCICSNSQDHRSCKRSIATNSGAGRSRPCSVTCRSCQMVLVALARSIGYLTDCRSTGDVCSYPVIGRRAQSSYLPSSLTCACDGQYLIWPLAIHTGVGTC